MPSSVPSPLQSQTEPLISAFASALRQRIGRDRFEMWFARSVDWAFKSDGDIATVQIIVAGEFALDRLRKNYVREIRAAAATLTPVPHVELVAAAMRSQAAAAVEQQSRDEDSVDAEADGGHSPRSTSPRSTPPSSTPPSSTPPSSAPPSSATTANRRGRPRRTTAGGSSTPLRRSGAMNSLSDLAAASIASATQRHRARESSHQATSHGSSSLQGSSSSHGSSSSAGDFAPVGNPVANVASSPPPRTHLTMDNFIVGPSSALAHTAATMVCSSPSSSSLLYFSGASGVGKSHLLSAITDTLRRRHRMRSVLHVSAEQFTNDFVAVVGKSTITNFRTRYRKVDALLIDDVHFIAGKKATMREFVQTIQHVSAAGCPIVLAGATTPHETEGFTAELAGRMTSGLVCPLMPLCDDVRRRLLMRYVETRCPLAIEGEVLDKIVPMLPCDGRMISGVANAIHLMQRMNGRSPNWTEVKTHCSHLLRGALGEVNMKVIERAVCDLFNLESDALRSGSQSRRVSQPRMLAMYLSRQKTSSAYSEIAKHYNVRSHTTAMAAEKNVEKWLAGDKPIGRGPTALTTDEAIEKIDSILRKHG